MLDGTLFGPDWLEHDRYVQASAYYYKQWDEFLMPFHTHDSIEVMYVISGICRIDFADQGGMMQDSVILKKGEFIMLNAADRHRLIVNNGTPCRMLNIEFNIVAEQSIFPSMKALAEVNRELRELFQTAPRYLVLRDSDEVYHTLKRLVLELDGRERDGCSGTMLELLFAQLLLQMAKIYSSSSYKGERQLDIYVSKSIAYIHQNYDRSIQAKDIAEAVNLHHGYLHRIFHMQTGRTLTQYLTELRLSKAKMLLTETDVPIEDICEYIGVGSRQYFHALFKKHTSFTPVQYRVQMSELQRNERAHYIDYK